MPPCPIIAISRPGSRRLELLKNHLTGLGLHAIVVPGVYLEGPVEAIKEYDQALRKSTLGYDLTKGEIGCFLGHKSAWALVAAGEKPCLIIEDDARLRYDSPKHLEELASAIAGTKIVVRLFSQRHPRSRIWRRLSSGLDIVRPLSAGHSAVGYMLDPTSAKALLISSKSFWQTVDDQIDDEPAHSCVIMHTIPELISHDDEGSSLIGERRKPLVSLLFRIRREWLRVLRKIRLSLHRSKVDRTLNLQ